ncbi:hypothetical protein [Calothrix sp. PCC 7507]|uniref:hypothetical protein n=1 Tax=Calothrix sp. PCC 7507 TaxID=99598 RepID=UPI00029EC616|nr:hypothetical protein [Calothrix sp. PCC 7507]AFY32240.1 hypothetical protein Cal7507_1784 [Calothrix sp. PCC 7507]
MDLNELIWTKNIKPQKSGGWAYKSESIANLYPDLRIFTLNWKNSDHKDENNASAPQEGELIILRQYAKVTHIVKMLNNQLYREINTEEDFNICRLVQVIWMTDDWENSPHNDKVFDCAIHFPSNGKAIKLDKIQEFQKRWNTAGLEFQQYVQGVLNIH